MLLLGYHQFPQSDDHQDAFRAEFKAAFRVVFKADQTATQTDVKCSQQNVAASTAFSRRTGTQPEYNFYSSYPAGLG